MQPLGYIVQQHAEGRSRPARAYDKWVQRIPLVYRSSVEQRNFASIPDPDPECLARLKHYRSLVPMAQEARKPIFQLTSADGAIGNHSRAAQDAYRDFMKLAKIILSRVEDLR